MAFFLSLLTSELCHISNLLILLLDVCMREFVSCIAIFFSVPFNKKKSVVSGVFERRMICLFLNFDFFFFQCRYFSEPSCKRDLIRKQGKYWQSCLLVVDGQRFPVYC